MARPGGRQFNGEIPEELRRFFGDDGAPGRFFFELPTPPRGFEQQGLGTGVIISDDGYVLTNNHVVENADEVTVTLSDKRRLTAEVIGTDRATDIAVLRIKANGLLPAKLGDSSNLEVGEWALAIGSPFGLDQTVTAGIISAVGRANMGITDYEDFIQTDAAINPGNSGGPLVNLKGEVIGINTAIASRTGGYQGIGFSIPSNMARQVMESIVESGTVTRGYLGAMIQDLNADLAQSFGFDSSEGVLIGDVVEGGPAEQAGLQSGDIVTRFNGRVVERAAELRNAVASTPPETAAAVEFFRDGDRRTVDVKIGVLDQQRLAAARPGGRSAASAELLGMQVRDVTPEIARQLGVEGNQAGVVVTAVDPGGLAARAGIRPGDLLLAIGSSRIQSATDFRDAVENIDLDAGIRLQVERDGARRFVFLRSRG
jgi:serine protease Do